MRLTRLKQRSLPESEFRILKHRNGGFSSFEERRMKNIAENKAILNQIMDDLAGWKPGKENKPKASPVTPSKREKRRSLPTFQTKSRLRRNPGRAARPLSLTELCDSAPNPCYIDWSDPLHNEQRLLVKFSFCNITTEESNTDDLKMYDSEHDSDDQSEDDDSNYLWQPEPSVHRTTRFYKDIQEVTDEDIAAVAERTSDKIYNTNIGTTCHQCRQKTIDTKTICRNKECAGVRGQFCGPCLKNRYGEDARETLRDSRWICPPCRGICNCSFCRRKAGRGATGILIHLARENGYNDVASYLKRCGIYMSK